MSVLICCTCADWDSEQNLINHNFDYVTDAISKCGLNKVCREFLNLSSDVYHVPIGSIDSEISMDYGPAEFETCLENC